MLTDRQTPWPGATYNGFSDAPARDPGPARRTTPRVPTRGLLLGGVAAAIGLGLAFGFVTRPDFGDDGRAREPMRAVTAPAAVDAPAPVASQFEIEVNQPAPPPTPVSAGKLEVLPPDLARAAPRAAPIYTGPPPARAASAPPVLQLPARVTPPPVQVIAPRPAPPPAPARVAVAAPEFRPSFNCSYARTVSERMVCGDEELAAADRRLARAYERAIAAGIPARALRAEQDDWLSIRDDAARRSPGAVANVYEQRIGELEELAESF